MKIKILINYLLGLDKFLSIPLGLTLFSSLLITLVFLLNLNLLPQRLPFFYSLPWGSNQLAEKEQLLILPAIMIAVALLNFIIYSQLHSTQTILKRMLLLNIVLIDFIISFAALKIILTFI